MFHITMRKNSATAARSLRVIFTCSGYAYCVSTLMTNNFIFIYKVYIYFFFLETGNARQFCMRFCINISNRVLDQNTKLRNLSVHNHMFGLSAQRVATLLYLEITFMVVAITVIQLMRGNEHNFCGHLLCLFQKFQ